MGKLSTFKLQKSHETMRGGSEVEQGSFFVLKSHDSAPPFFSAGVSFTDEFLSK